MGKPVIAVDLDDVLGDENGAVLQFINETYGSNHTLEDYYNVEAPYSSFWETVWGVGPEEGDRRYRAFMASSHKRNLKPLPGARTALKNLIKNYELVMVTSRGQELNESTIEWLSQHFPDIFKDMHFAAHWNSGKGLTKAEVCQQIGAKYLIDDHLDHCSAAAKVGINCLLFGSYGWNKLQKLPKGVTRCKDWQAVKEYFNAQG